MKMTAHHDKVFVLLDDGKQIPLAKWQSAVGYEIGSARIGKHFWFTESKFMQDLQDYGRLVVCEKLIKVADRYRDLKGSPVRVNSFNRNRVKQESLKAQGFKAASISPHEYFLAMDVDTDTDHDTRISAAMVREAARQLGIKVRVGFEEYLRNKQTFIHIDVCPEFFAPGAIWHLNPHPIQWEKPISW